MAAHRDWRTLRCENGHEHQGWLGETGPGFMEWRPTADCPDCGCRLYSRDEIEDMDAFAGDPDELDPPAPAPRRVPVNRDHHTNTVEDAAAWEQMHEGIDT